MKVWLFVFTTLAFIQCVAVTGVSYPASWKGMLGQLQTVVPVNNSVLCDNDKLYYRTDVS